MKLFSLVSTCSGFGIFFFLSRTEQPWSVTLLVAFMWCALFVWLFLSTRRQ